MDKDICQKCVIKFAEKLKDFDPDRLYFAEDKVERGFSYWWNRGVLFRCPHASCGEIVGLCRAKDHVNCPHNNTEYKNG